MKEIAYKDYYITIGFYRNDDITVQYCGDDIEFNSIEEAKKFIDEVA